MFAEVKSIADGDSLLFHIPSNHLLTVSTVANGQRNVHFQKLWSEDFTITPYPRKLVYQLIFIDFLLVWKIMVILLQR